VSNYLKARITLQKEQASRTVRSLRHHPRKKGQKNKKGKPAPRMQSVATTSKTEKATLKHNLLYYRE
jgi:hypothetical protein